ncbi:alpha/beta hydrolase [Bdellovibrio bacteriovorus]
MKTEILHNLRTYDVKNFQIETLRLDSSILKNNPLGDSATRFNPVLIPANSNGPWPVVFVLSGFTGNAPFYFNSKFNEANTVQVIDQAFSRGEAPEAVYVFVDALTTWGGSQFINSPATGNYEDYIIQELVPVIKKKYSLSNKPSDWCVTGGSSGGYGALHLASKHPEIFGVMAAVAPDCFFEASLLPEIYQALPLWEKYKGSSSKALEDLRNGKLTKMKNWHNLLNVFGMAACYGAKGEKGEFELPLDMHTAEKIPDLWEKWLEKDPLHFLEKRMKNLKHLHAIYIDVGTKDNFHLQYGSRQISRLLKSHGILHDYVEFDGNHFDIGNRRIEIWKFLASRWR